MRTYAAGTSYDKPWPEQIFGGQFRETGNRLAIACRWAKAGALYNLAGAPLGRPSAKAWSR